MKRHRKITPLERATAALQVAQEQLQRATTNSVRARHEFLRCDLVEKERLLAKFHEDEVIVKLHAEAVEAFDSWRRKFLGLIDPKAFQEQVLAYADQQAAQKEAEELAAGAAVADAPVVEEPVS